MSTPAYESGTVLPGSVMSGAGAPPLPDPLLASMLAAEVSKREEPIRLRQGTVTATALVWGPSASPTLTVNLGGVDIPGCRFLSGYQPRVGDSVWCIRNGLDILVLGSLAREGVSPLEGPVTCTYGSGFTYASSSTNDPPMVYAQGDWAYVSGRVKRTSGTGNSPFTIPVGYRPRTELVRAYISAWAVNNGNALGPAFGLEVQNNGSTTLNPSTTPTWNSTTWIAVWGSYPRERV